MKSGDRVRLTTEAKVERLSPRYHNSIGTVISTCAGIAVVKWDDAALVNYGHVWLEVVEHAQGVQQTAASRIDTQFAKGWKR